MGKLRRIVTPPWSQVGDSCWRAAQELPSTYPSLLSLNEIPNQHPNVAQVTSQSLTLRLLLLSMPLDKGTCSLNYLFSRNFQCISSPQIPFCSSWSHYLVETCSLQHGWAWLYMDVCCLMKQGPAYSLEFLEVHSAEIKSNLTTWLPGYRLLASLQISNQPDETKILCLCSAGWAIFVNSVFSGKKPFQMDCQGLQVQVKWSKEFQLKTNRKKNNCSIENV